PAADVLVRAMRRLPAWLPGAAGLGDRLVGPGLVLAPQLQAERLGGAVGPLDQLFLGVAAGASGSTPAPFFPVGFALPAAPLPPTLRAGRRPPPRRRPPRCPAVTRAGAGAATRSPSLPVRGRAAAGTRAGFGRARPRHTGAGGRRRAPRPTPPSRPG